MNIRISPHALERAEERGTNEAEIKEVLSTGFSLTAKHGRMGRGKVFEFGQAWCGKPYQQKRVEVFYTHEGDDLIIVTTYVFYGKWE